MIADTRRERKVVTVLFCDLVGFTARAESLDPEDVADLLSGYHATLRAELERRGGTVEKFIGDAVMALFGAPIAHEDDPERALRAALAIRDWARQSEGVEVRVAVNTGEALVTLGARPSEGEGMAAGDVVNTAARLQAAAPVNGIIVRRTGPRARRSTTARRSPSSPRERVTSSRFGRHSRLARASARRSSTTLPESSSAVSGSSQPCVERSTACVRNALRSS